MKKTLVALAVLAASGASFAQVTMTGEFTWGYKATTVDTAVSPAASTATSASGFGVDYSNINFAATEDLGGGTKVSVLMGFDGADRSNDGGTALTGQNANITLANGASKLKLATAQNDDYLSEGVAGLGNPVWIDQDGHVFSAHTSSDSITYSYALGAVTLGYQYLEAAADLGEGLGQTGSKNQARNLIQATYTAGPLTANVGFGIYNNEVDNSTATSKNVARFAVSYDLGVAKVGAAYANTKKTVGSNVDTFLAVAVPMGALTLGADWAQRKTDFDGTAAGDGNKSGYGIGAAYALSKRTQLVANYRSYEAAVNAASKSTDTRLYIDHSF
jgi:predicted porin